MTSKHTPGPWGTFEIRSEGSGEVRTGVCAFDGDYMIADVGWDRPNEAEANARLIAAAPDLLEEAKATVEAHDYGSEEAFLRSLNRLSKLIAKAEGKE